eukprot:TRINITY_DN15215_c0_g1_i3.p1 TRINITY_DN15215_c0_g1~~TRINITY_DN15215_c0_g1_i3.p1  ORF type:complete len:786 (-),score=115.73 TRINITY_DN15215_c0_g1_i3:47-2404(-)
MLYRFLLVIDCIGILANAREAGTKACAADGECNSTSQDVGDMTVLLARRMKAGSLVASADGSNLSWSLLGGYGCTNYQTASLKKTWTRTASVCGHECMSTSGCVAFQFLSGPAPGCSASTQHTGFCELWKEPCQQNGVPACSPWQQYKVSSSPPALPAKHLGGYGCRNWQTATLSSTWTADVGGCEQKCSEAHGCVAFQWLSGHAPGCSDSSQVRGHCTLWKEQCSMNFDHACSPWKQYERVSSPPPSPTPAPTPAPAPAPAPHPVEPGYDVIVVGGGLVGSTVAAQLVEKLPSSFKVLLLEAGKASQAVLGGSQPPADPHNKIYQSVYENYNQFFPSGDRSKPRFTKYDVPGNYMSMNGWVGDWSQEDTWGDAVPAYQCRVLGGCGVLNGALHQIPDGEMFDAWPTGWKWSDMQPYFDELKQKIHITQTPSAEGKHYLGEAGKDFVAGVMSRAGWKETKSMTPRAGTMDIPFVAARDGVRQSTAAVFLPEAKKRGLELRVETDVQGLVKNGGRVTGVKVKNQWGGQETIQLKSSGLLVMSAGALNTPRILLLNGINGWGQVGKGVSDHWMKAVAYSVPSWASGAAATTPVTSLFTNRDFVRQFANSQTGPLSQFGPTFTVFFKSKKSAGPADAADVEMYMMPMSEPNKLSVSFALMRPTCTSANLKLSSWKAVWAENNLQGCGKDHDILWDAIGQMDWAMEKVGAHRMGNPSGNRAFNHWAGSCKLGTCVDSQSLIVKGTENVAVADASLLPGQVWAHPAATLTAVGLKASDLIASKLRGRSPR